MTMIVVLIWCVYRGVLVGSSKLYHLWRRKVIRTSLLCTGKMKSDVVDVASTRLLVFARVTRL